MSYELRYHKVGEEEIMSGFLPLGINRESAVAQAKSLAESLSQPPSKASGFFVRGPNGETIPIDVPETTVSN